MSKLHVITFVLVMYLLFVSQVASSETSNATSNKQKISLTTSIDYENEGAQETEGLILTAKLDEDLIHTCGKISLDVTLKNVMGIPIVLPCIGYNQEYKIESKDSQGNKLKVKKPVLVSLSNRSLKPGKEFKNSLIVNKWVNITDPGVYSLQLHRTVPRLDGNGYVEIYSNKIVFEITSDDITKYEISKKTAK